MSVFLQCWKERSWVCQRKGLAPEWDAEDEWDERVRKTRSGPGHIRCSGFKTRPYRGFSDSCFMHLVLPFFIILYKRKFSTWKVCYDLTNGITNELKLPRQAMLTGRDWFLWWILILFVRVFPILLNVHVFKKIKGVFVAP